MAVQQNTTQLAVRDEAAPSQLTREQRIRELVGLQYQYMNASGSLPKHIKSPAHLRMAYELLTPLRLNVAANLRNTFWNPSTNTMELCNDAPLAACQMRREEYVGTVEYHVNVKHERRSPQNFIGFKAEGAVCCAKRRGKDDVVAMFTLEQARQAGLMTKDNWRKYPEAMLTKRARTIALRQQWGDVLQGTGIFEADEYVPAPVRLRDADLAQSMLATPAKPEPAKVVEAEVEAAPAQAAEAQPAETSEQDSLEAELDVLFGAGEGEGEGREPGTD